MRCVREERTFAPITLFFQSQHARALLAAMEDVPNDVGCASADTTELRIAMLSKWKC